MKIEQDYSDLFKDLVAIEPSLAHVSKKQFNEIWSWNHWKEWCQDVDAQQGASRVMKTYSPKSFLIHLLVFVRCLRIAQGDSFY